MMGVRIESGLQNWQIVQQRDGAAEFRLAGSFAAGEGVSRFRVLARVVREDSGEPVTGWEEAETAGRAGGWRVALTVPAGGLYRVETCLNQDNGPVEWSQRGDMIHHVAGQSNSAGYGRDAILDAPEIGVHLLRNNGKWDLASHPLGDSTGTIHPVNAAASNTAHSPHLHFGKYLKRALGHPIGLLQTALGGTPLERWNPKEKGDLYANMVEIIKSTGYGIRGVLWYQGCSDTNSQGESQSYYRRFMELVDGLRADIKEPELPFITVQLNRWLSSKDGSDVDPLWGAMREAQRQAGRRPGVWVVPSTDCRLTDGIHNSAASNLVLGERMAKAALGGIYGKKSAYLAPDAIGAQRTGATQIELAFGNILGRIETYGLAGRHSPFSVEDETGPNPVRSYAASGRDRIVIDTEREIRGACRVHGAYEANPAVFVPYDTGSYLPMLAFYDLDVQSDEGIAGTGCASF